MLKLSSILNEIQVQGNSINSNQLGKRIQIKYIGNSNYHQLHPNCYYSGWECGKFCIIYFGINDVMYIIPNSKIEKQVDIDDGDWPSIKENIGEKIKNKDYILVK